jgi:hypothetical protein
MKRKYQNIKIRLILNSEAHDFRDMTPCAVTAHMVFLDFSYVCIEVKKGLEIPCSDNSALNVQVF